MNGSSLTPPQPPKNLTIESLPTHKALRWEKSPDAEGYIIYRTSSTLPKASFSLITPIPVTEIFYNDSVTDNKTYRYSVQAIKKKVSDKAIYFLGSDTIMKNATITSIDDRIANNGHLTVMPNPARTFVDIDCTMMNEKYTIYIVNTAGELVKTIDNDSPNIVRWNLVDDCNGAVISGNYYIHIRSAALSYLRMISVIQ